MKNTISSALIALALGLAAPAHAAGLADDAKFNEIVQTTFVVERVKQACPDISVRPARSKKMINDMAKYVAEMGYSQAEMTNELASPVAQTRHMANAEQYIRSKGYDLSKPRSFCDFARAEMKAGTAVGKLLK